MQSPRILALSILLSFTISCDKFTDDCLIQIPSDVYSYPMTTSSPKWKDYSPTEIWEMDQLPEDIKNEISTPGLLETCILFPYYGDLGLTYFPQEVFDFFRNNFNGCYELLQRDDAPKVIFERYKLMSPLCENNNYPDFLGRGQSVGMAFMAIEMILAQNEILNKFNHEQLKVVAKESLMKYDQKVSKNSSYLKFSLLICGRILKIENYQPFINELNNNLILQSYIDECYVDDMDLLSNVRNHTINYLKTTN